MNNQKRHPRESGDPLILLDSRLRGNDIIGRRSEIVFMNRSYILFLIIIYCLSILSSSVFAREKSGKLKYDSLKEFQYEASAKRDEAINLLDSIIKKHPKNEDKAELLLRLAELYWEKSRHLYFQAVSEYDKTYEQYLKNKKGPEPTLNDKESKETRKKAISTYQEILDNYRNYPKRDFVLFHLALNLTELGMKAAGFTLYQELLADYPKSQFIPNVLLATGEYYFEKVKIREAMEQYKKVLEYQDPQLYGYALYKLAWCYYNLNDFDKSISTFKQVVSFCEKQRELSSENKLSLIEEALNDIVVVYADKGSINEAKEYFARVEGGGYYTKLLILLGDTFKKNGESKNAIDTYEKFLEESPLHAQAPFVYINLIEVYRKVESFDFVGLKLKKFVENYKPNSSWYIHNAKNLEVLSNVKVVTESLLRSIGAEYHKKAERTENKSLYAISSAIYRDYLSLYPNSGQYYDIRFFLGEIEFQLEEYENAAKTYAEVVNDEKNDKFREKSAYAIILCFKKLAYGESGESSLDELKKVKIDPPLPIQNYEEKLLRAVENYLKITKNDEERVRVTYLSARILFKYNYFDQAVELFNEIITKNPESSLAILSANYILEIFNSGKNWIKLSEWANIFYNSPISKNLKFKNKMKDIAESAEFKMILSKADIKTPKDIAFDFTEFEKKYKFSSLGDEALYNAILNYKKIDDFDSVIKYSVELISTYPKSNLASDVTIILASLYEQIGDFDKSGEEYEKFVALNKGHKDVQIILEKSLIMRRALQDYRKAFFNMDQQLILAKSKGKKLEIQLKKANYFFQLGSYKSALTVYNEIIAESLATSTFSIEARFRAGVANLLIDRTSDGIKLISSAEILYSKMENKDLISQDVIFNAKFEVANLLFKKFSNIKLLLPINKLKTNLAQKLNLLNELKDRYIEVIEGGDVTLTIAALYMIGQTYQLMSEALFNAPVPSGYTEEELKSYKSALEEQAFPIEDKAVDAYERALKKAMEFGNYNSWVKKALKELVKYKPSSYIPIRESIDKVFFRTPYESKLVGSASNLSEKEEIIFSYLNNGKFNEAIELTRDLLKIERKEEYYILLAHIYTLDKKYEMAELIFSLKNKWTAKEIYLEMAHSAFLSEDYEKGILRLKDVIKIDPSNLYAIVNLAVVNFYFGNYENARLLFEKIDKKLLNIRELYYMSVAYRIKKEYNKAVMCLEEILVRDPMNKLALLDFAILNYEYILEYEIAEDYFNRFLKIKELTEREKNNAKDFLNKIEVKRKTTR